MNAFFATLMNIYSYKTCELKYNFNELIVTKTCELKYNFNEHIVTKLAN